MTRIEKLLQEIRSNPRAVTYADFKRILEHEGISIREGKGSHCVAELNGELYTIKKPSAGGFVHPKTVKHCLQAFGLWE